MTQEEIQIIGHHLPKPALHSRWIHRNSGHVYQVYDITNEDSKKTSKIITISYRRLSDNTKWSRYITDWYQDFEPSL